MLGTAWGWQAGDRSLATAIAAAAGSACWMLALVFRRRAPAGLLLVACVLFLGVWNAALRRPADSVGHLLAGCQQAGGLAMVEGIVVEDLGRPESVQARSLGFRLRVRKIAADGEWRPASGSLWVRFRPQHSGPVPRYGEYWRFTGVVKRGRGGSFLCASGRYSRKLAEGQGSLLFSLVFKVRQRGQEILEQGLEHCPRESAIFNALLLGYRSELAPALRQRFSVTGSMHIFAISGLHIGVIAMLLGVLLRFSGLSRDKWIIVFVPVLAFYTVMTGARTSAVRAALMAVCLGLAPLLGRRSDPPSALSLAAILILAAVPGQIVDAGFQLSFAVVAGILLWSRWIIGAGRWWPVQDPWSRRAPGLWQRVGRTLAVSGLRMLLVSLAAWWASAPLVAYYFHLFSPIAIVANLFLVPLVSVVVVSGGLSLLIGPVWHAVSGILNRVAALLIQAMAGLVGILGDIPVGHWNVRGFPWWLAAAWFVPLGTAAACGWSRISRRCTIVAVLLSLAGAGTAMLNPAYEVVVWNSGGRVSFFVSDGRGGTVLADPGSAEQAGRLRHILCRYGIDRLGAILLTAAGRENYGSAVLMGEEYRPQQLWFAGRTTRVPDFRRFLAQLTRTGTTLCLLSQDHPVRCGTIRSELVRVQFDGQQAGERFAQVVELEIDGMWLYYLPAAAGPSLAGAALRPGFAGLIIQDLRSLVLPDNGRIPLAGKMLICAEPRSGLAPAVREWLRRLELNNTQVLLIPPDDVVLRIAGHRYAPKWLREEAGVGKVYWE